MAAKCLLKRGGERARTFLEDFCYNYQLHVIQSRARSLRLSDALLSVSAGSPMINRAKRIPLQNITSEG